MTRLPIIGWATLCGALMAIHSSNAAEIVRLDESNFDRFVPVGKEVDAIYGDYALRNDRIVVIVANPVAGRKANMTVGEVGGCVIDMTRLDAPNDQLSCYYPGARRLPLRSAVIGGSADQPGNVVTLTCASEPADGKPTLTVLYSLRDGDDFLTVRNIYKNTTDKPLEIAASDDVRADRTFGPGRDANGKVGWVYDEWWKQAYGFAPLEGTIEVKAANRAFVIAYSKGGEAPVKLEPGAEFEASVRIICGADPLHVRAVVNRLQGVEQHGVAVTVTDPSGPIDTAVVNVEQLGKPYASGQTGANGVLRFDLPAGTYKLTVESLGRTGQSFDMNVTGPVARAVKLDAPGYVKATITDEKGGPIPCKVQFIGKNGTKDPFFFADSGEHAVHNLYYTHNGRFRQAIAPGTYDVIISRGFEYDAVYASITVERGRDTEIAAKLIRTVDTTGWISADFHAHSSPSGDNTASQYGRVLNSVAEHLEFIPCTEHNRIDTYLPHLKRMGVEHLVLTCSGMELTGSIGDVNHQNAFPLVMKPRIQDNGAPLVDANPRVQIERLALWDNKSEKLVQQNHPNIIKHAFDKNLDGKFDGGYGMFPFMDVIEVHPLHPILQGPSVDEKTKVNNGGNTIHSWLVALNQGIRVPGVVNTDAHYNFHGTGWMRIYVKSPSDDPAQVKVLDMVHAAERGNIIMTTGPYLEVTGESASGKANVGEDLAASDGKVKLRVRVQCANWCDINRVQVLINGRLDPELNFTRKANPDRFSDKTTKFEGVIEVPLDGDAHLIVAAAGEGLTLGPVWGPQWGKYMPIAVSNPIFVDVDGNGFKANGDTLGAPLPVNE